LNVILTDARKQCLKFFSFIYFRRN